MIKTHEIYKKNKWNMLNVEVNGTRYIVREISDQWGEDTYTFLSRPAMMQWAQEKFAAGKFEGDEEERQGILQAFEQI